MVTQCDEYVCYSMQHVTIDQVAESMVEELGKKQVIINCLVLGMFPNTSSASQTKIALLL